MAKLLSTLAVGIRTGDTPVASGLVYAYDTGTTTPGTYLYTEPTLTTPHSNPATLDADGKLEAYVSDTANFRLRVRNAADDTTIEDWDPAVSSQGTTTAAITVGTSLADSVTAGANETLDDFLEFLWTALSGQSAAATAKDLRYLHTGTGAVGRYLRNVLSDAFNVKDFGAVGDGATDDQAAIQAAIDAAATAGGGCVVFPGDVYLIGGTLNINNQDNVALFGHGPGSIIRANFSNAAIVTIAGTSDGVEIAHLQFQGAGGSGTTTALGISVASTVGDTAGEVPVNIHDCVFSGNADGTGLNVGVECLGQRGIVNNCYFQRHYGTNSCGVRLNTGSDFRVTNNHMLMVDAASGRAQYGIANPAGTGGGGSVIANNFIEGASLAGIYLSSVTGAVIQGNRVEGGSSHGIDVVGSSDVTICGNSVNSTGGAGIAIGTDCSGFTVTGNSSQSNTTHGIFVRQTADSSATVPRNGMILGNNCRSNTQNGINLTGSDKVAVVGNVITDNGSNGSYAGIEVTTAYPMLTHRGGNNNAIVGNYVTDTSGSVHSVPIRIQRGNGGGGAIGDDGNLAIRTTAVMLNRFQHTNEDVYTFGVSGVAVPIFVGNVATGALRPRTDYTANATLILEQSGAIITNTGATGAVTITLPSLSANETTQGIEFWFVRAAAQNFTLAPSGVQSIIARDGNAASITLTGSTDRFFHVFSIGTNWYADVDDYTT